MTDICQRISLFSSTDNLNIKLGTREHFPHGNELFQLPSSKPLGPESLFPEKRLKNPLNRCFGTLSISITSKRGSNQVLNQQWISVHRIKQVNQMQDHVFVFEERHCIYFLPIQFGIFFDRKNSMMNVWHRWS